MKQGTKVQYIRLDESVAEKVASFAKENRRSVSSELATMIDIALKWREENAKEAI